MHAHGDGERRREWQAVYRLTTLTLPSEVAAKVEHKRFVQRHARVVWLGYAAQADHLADMLRRRDRSIDDRRLCVECDHARPGWRCVKNAGFLTDILRRCAHFHEEAGP
jgi:hypothetical protein